MLKNNHSFLILVLSILLAEWLWNSLTNHGGTDYNLTKKEKEKLIDAVDDANEHWNAL